MGGTLKLRNCHAPFAEKLLTRDLPIASLAVASGGAVAPIAVYDEKNSVAGSGDMGSGRALNAVKTLVIPMVNTQGRVPTPTVLCGR